MIDPHAPVIPGEGAAGLTVGAHIGEVLSPLGEELPPEPIPSGGTRYRSEMVDLWERNGLVTQIMVHGSYRGRLLGKIGLGATIAEIEQQIGPCEEDEEDNLTIRSVAGFCFDAEGEWPPAHKGVDFSHPAVRAARVTAMYVFGGADRTQ